MYQFCDRVSVISIKVVNSNRNNVRFLPANITYTVHVFVCPCNIIPRHVDT